MDRAAQAEGTRGRRRDSPEQAFRGGGSPEFTVSGLPGVDLSGAGVEGRLGVMRKPPEGLTGFGKGRSVDGKAVAALRPGETRRRGPQRRPGVRCELRATLASAKAR